MFLGTAGGAKVPKSKDSDQSPVYGIALTKDQIFRATGFRVRLSSLAVQRRAIIHEHITTKVENGRRQSRREAKSCKRDCINYSHTILTSSTNNYKRRRQGLKQLPRLRNQKTTRKSQKLGTFIDYPGMKLML